MGGQQRWAGRVEVGGAIAEVGGANRGPDLGCCFPEDSPHWNRGYTAFLPDSILSLDMNISFIPSLLLFKQSNWI